MKLDPNEDLQAKAIRALRTAETPHEFVIDREGWKDRHIPVDLRAMPCGACARPISSRCHHVTRRTGYYGGP